MVRKLHFEQDATPDRFEDQWINVIICVIGPGDELKYIAVDGESMMIFRLSTG